MEGLLGLNLLGNEKLFGGAGSNIKSIQRGQTSIGTAATSVSAALSSVDPAMSVPFLSANSTEVPPNNICVRGSVGSATTLNLNRFSSGWSVTVSWQVIEFQNVKSLQSGLTSLASGSASTTATINAVNLNKSLLAASFSTDDGTSTHSGALYLMHNMTNATTITFTHPTTEGSKTIQWYVVEFN